MKTTTAVAALAALAQESRLRVFRALVQAAPDGLPAGKVSAKVGIVPATLSLPAINGLIGYLTENCCGGGECEATPRAAAARAR